MQVSLIDLIQRAQDIGPDSGLTVHYPEDGHQRLSAVEKEHFWFTQRRDLIYRILERAFGNVPQGRDAQSSLRGIDLGCGSGFTAVWLTERGIPTYGQDVYSGFSEYRKQGRGRGFLQGDITSVDPSPEFDFVLLLDVIEHIPDDKDFVDHVGKMLKPGGRLLITVPAFSWLWSDVDELSGHRRRYAKRDLAAFESLPTTQYRIELASYFYASILPLYFISRMASRFRKNAQRGAPRAELTPNPRINAALKRLLRAETSVFFAAGIPIGSSLVAVLRKTIDR
jgi:SAM-dependent methyltransferase